MRDFNRKYGFRTNPEVFAKLVYVINHYNCLGILLRDRIVEANEVFQLNPSNSAHARALQVQESNYLDDVKEFLYLK